MKLPEAELIMKVESKIPEIKLKKDLLASWFNTINLKMDLVYRMSDHGLTYKSFYKRCSGKQNLLIFVKSKVYN